MAPADPGVVLAVELAVSDGPRRVRRMALQLPAGSTVRDALRAGGVPLPGTAGAVADWVVAVGGRLVGLAVPLRDRDRVELLRPLQVDPKEARRLRYRSQGERRASRRR